MEFSASSMALKLKTSYVLAILMLIGFFFRVHFLGYQSFWIDEVFSVNAAKGILQHGYPLLESGFVYSRDILNTYLIAFFMGIFGDTPSAARIVSVIFGVLMILLSFYIGKEFFDKKTGLVFAFLMTFSYWEILWSRQARMYIQLQFFYFLSLLLFYRFVKHPSFKKLLWLGLAVLLAVLSHSLGLTLGLVFLLYYAVAHWKMFLRPREYFAKLALWVKKENRLLGNWAVFFWLGFLIVAAYIAYRVVGGLLADSVIDISHFDQYLFYLRNTHLLFYYFAAVGIFIALVKDIHKGLLLGLAYAVPFVFIAEYIWLLHYRYIYFILPLLFVLFGYSLLFVFEQCRKFGVYIGMIFVLIVSFAALSHGFVFVPLKAYDLEVQTPQPDFARAYGFIKERFNESDIVVADYPAVSQLYLGRADYWIAFSLSGLESNEYYLNESIVSEKYANATILRSASELQRVMQNSSGWIVLDNLAWRRIDDSFRDFIASNLTYYENASQRRNVWSGIRVYGWDNYVGSGQIYK